MQDARSPVQRGFLRRFEHDTQANTALVQAMRGRAVDERTIAVMAHTLAAEWLWLRRLGHDVPDAAVWPDWSVQETGGQLEALGGAWRAVVDGLDAVELAREIHYVNSLGESWTNTVADILEHVLLHSSHHRGQVIAALRDAGIEPPYVDFIQAVRTGRLP